MVYNCLKCGKEMPYEQRYCDACFQEIEKKAKLLEAMKEEIHEMKTGEDKKPVKPSQKSRRYRDSDDEADYYDDESPSKLPIILAFLLGLAVAAAIFFFF